MIRRLLARALQPLFGFTLGFRRFDDPWERVHANPALRLFGPGSRRDFRWYFEGESTVPAGSLDGVCEWLLQCEYAHDPHVFQESDFWQHPCTFEHLRKGDCEDHALWAWRKLTELGIAAEFYVGRRRARGECDAAAAPSSHAWVVCRIDGVEYLFEAVAGARERMLRPLAEVRSEYVPHFCVDQRFQRHAFAGYLLYLREEGRKRRSRDVRDRDRAA